MARSKKAELDAAFADGLAEGLALSGDCATTDGDAAYRQGYAEGYRQGFAEGYAMGTAAERARIGAIISSPEASGREAVALHLAFDTVFAAEDARALLATVSVQALAIGTDDSEDRTERLIAACRLHVSAGPFRLH